VLDLIAMSEWKARKHDRAGRLEAVIHTMMKAQERRQSKLPGAASDPDRRWVKGEVSRP
jgi:hypothetical protein